MDKVFRRYTLLGISKQNGQLECTVLKNGKPHKQYKIGFHACCPCQMHSKTCEVMTQRESDQLAHDGNDKHSVQRVPE